MATVSYSASLRTRKTSSSSDAKSDRACQEFYSDDYNYVGIIHFSGMDLRNKIITGVSIKATSASAGYGSSHTKTVYLRKSNYQAAAASGVTGSGYAGAALGTFDGSFYGNTTTCALTGTLLTNVAAYIQAGNNTFTIYNPNATASPKGYSYNYFQWTAVTITVTYEEAASIPSVSETTCPVGGMVTIYTNRASTAATHTLRYTFGADSGYLAQDVGDSVVWLPSLTLAEQLPNSTSGLCTIICETYVNGTLTGTRTCTLTLTVPDTIVPKVTGISCREATSSIAEQFGVYVRSKSKLSVTLTAKGAEGSSIVSYRSTLDGAVYNGSSFTTAVLHTAGTNRLTVTVTDSRGRSGSLSIDLTVVDYSPPSLTELSAQRCNAAGTAVQMDGTSIRITAKGSVSPVNNKNTISCAVYAKASTETAWQIKGTIGASNFTVSAVNRLLAGTYDVLTSYDVKVTLSDYFGTVEQVVSVSTKQVMMDFYRDGSGIAFGKVAENSGKVEFGWPLELIEPLSIAQGGTGQTTASGTRNALGLGNTTGALPIANGGTGATTVASARNALGLGNTTGAVPVANGGTGATTAVAARTNLGITLSGLGAAPASHNHSAGEITSGTLNKSRLPFKFCMGSTSVSGSSSVTIDISDEGFTSVPCVFVTYATTSSNWSGDNGALKVYNKTKTGFSIVVGGSFNTSRAIDWLAIGY